jgi:Ni,Fe-hydrogenase I cytochrome b subunit
MNRLCIYTKDIQWITGKSASHSRYLLRQIKKHYQKEAHQPVNVQEFCQYMGMSVELVLSHLK